MTKVKFSLTITDSLIKTYRLVLKDKIILFPSLILVFFLAILDSYFDLYSVSEKMTLYQYLLKFFISKILALFAMGVTIQMGISLLNHSKIHVKSALILTCNKFVHLFIITSIYLLPTAYLNYKFFSNIEISLSNWWIWLLLVFVVLASFILIFAPMLIMAKNQTSLQAFFESYFFVKQHFRNVLIFISMVFFVHFFTLFLAESFVFIPVLGKSFFLHFFQGLGSGFVYVLTVIVFFELVQNNKQISLII